MIKNIIIILVSAGVGSFINMVVEKAGVNVWIARGIGGLSTLIIALLLYYLWVKKH